MKIALVHDYLRDFGGAERVLLKLSEMHPKAPIYTAFYNKNSPGYAPFADREVVESSYGFILKRWRLYSPLRFLLPWVWRNFNLSEYDVVITSSSNYIARGFLTGKNTRVISYCHTPPRFLYGFSTGMNWKKYWPVRVYGSVIGHFLRMFDFESAQEVDQFVANSKNVQARIEKFYRRDSKVIYPPVEVESISEASKNVERGEHYLIVSRLIGAKGLEEAVIAAKKLKIKLKIVGGSAGITNYAKKLKKIGGDVQFLGRLSDEVLWEEYAKARGFIALARDEDFGMTVVEAMAAGTAVIAFNGGGFKESVASRTGILVDKTDTKTLKAAFEEFERTKWDHEKIKKYAKKFGSERFEREMRRVVKNLA